MAEHILELRLIRTSQNRREHSATLTFKDISYIQYNNNVKIGSTSNALDVIFCEAVIILN